MAARRGRHAEISGVGLILELSNARPHDESAVPVRVGIGEQGLPSSLMVSPSVALSLPGLTLLVRKLFIFALSAG